MQGSRRGVERQGPRSHLEQRLLSSGMAAFVERDNEEEGCSEEEVRALSRSWRRTPPPLFGPNSTFDIWGTACLTSLPVPSLLQDPRSSATRRLSESLAAAVVMRLSLPGDVAAQLAALPATPSALSLALARDDGSGLVHLPVMEQGSLVWSPDVPGEALPQRSAAWQSFRSGRCLLWRRRLDRWDSCSPSPAGPERATFMISQAHLTPPACAARQPSMPTGLASSTFTARRRRCSPCRWPCPATPEHSGPPHLRWVPSQLLRMWMRCGCCWRGWPVPSPTTQSFCGRYGVSAACTACWRC